MAFIVKVKLVEKSVNRKVGIVMVLNVMNQYRIPGTNVIMYNSSRPSIPSQERFSTVVSPTAVRTATAEVAVAFMLAAFVKLSRTEEIVLERIDSEVPVVPAMVYGDLNMRGVPVPFARK